MDDYNQPTNHSNIHVQFLVKVPYKYILALCASTNLCLSNEKALADMIEKYLIHREGLPLLEEEDPSRDWSHLTEEEKVGRRLQEQKKLEDANAEILNKSREEKRIYNYSDKYERFNIDWQKVISSVHEEAQKRLQVKRLTKEEKKQLFQTVRFPALEHAELLNLATNPTFALANDLVVKGLSVKLGNFETNT